MSDEKRIRSGDYAATRRGTHITVTVIGGGKLDNRKARIVAAKMLRRGEALSAAVWGKGTNSRYWHAIRPAEIAPAARIPHDIPTNNKPEEAHA